MTHALHVPVTLCAIGSERSLAMSERRSASRVRRVELDDSEISTRLSAEQYAAIESELKFARGLARQFYVKRRNCGFELEDIEGAAFLGLCDAARRYDQSKKINFRTFCYFRIRGAMFDMFRKGPIPRAYFRRLESLNAEAKSSPVPEVDPEDRESEQEFGYPFAKNAAELFELMGFVDELRVEIDEISDSDRCSTGDENGFGPDTVLAVKETQEFMKKFLERLTDREKELMKLRYYYGYSLDEVSTAMGISSKSWVSRIHSRALDKLRKMMSRENVYSFQQI